MGKDVDRKPHPAALRPTARLKTGPRPKQTLGPKPRLCRMKRSFGTTRLKLIRQQPPTYCCNLLLMED